MLKKLLKKLRKPQIILTILFGFLVLSCTLSISISVGLFVDQYVVNTSVASFIDDTGKLLRCYPLTANSNYVAVGWCGDTTKESSNDAKDLVIPQYVYKRIDEEHTEQYIVKAIVKAGFRYCDFIKTVSFADNCEVDEIQEEAFYSCQNMTNFEFPEKCVKGIGASAFMDCRKLTRIDMNAVTAYIDAQIEADENNPNAFLTSNPFKIGDHAFSSCVALKGFSFPSNLSEIGESAFSSCSKIYSVILPEPDGVNTIIIHKYAFADCSSLAICNFGSNVSYIDSYAFAQCNKLKIYYIGSVTNEPTAKNPINNTFDAEFRKKHVGSNVGSESWSVPNDYVRITQVASAIKMHPDYPGFVYVKTPAGDITYEGTADHKSNIVLASPETEYITIFSFRTPEDYSYENYNAETKTVTIPDEIEGLPVLRIQELAFSAYNNEYLKADDIKKVVFNKQLVQIGFEAFKDCNKISDLDFSECEALREIGNRAFEIQNDVTNYDSVQGKDVTDKSKTNKAMNKPLLLPSSLYYIGYRAFYQFTNVTSLNLNYDKYNNSPTPHLRLIGNEAFLKLGSAAGNSVNYGKLDLVIPYSLYDGAVAVALPEGYGSNNGTNVGTWRWASIGTKAFMGCPLIKTVTMQAHPTSPSRPASSTIGTEDDTRTSFGNQAFSTCTYLERFVCNKLMSRLGTACFEYCSSLKELFLSTWANENIQSGETNVDGFNLGNGEGSSLFFNGDDSADKSIEFRDLVIYIQGTYVWPRRNNQPKYYVWNSDPKTYANEYMNTVGKKTQAPYHNAIRTDNIIGRSIVPTYYGVSYGDVHYVKASDGTALADDSNFNYNDTVAYITNNSKHTITRCYRSSTLASIDMEAWTIAANIETIGSCAFATLMNDCNPAIKVILPSSLKNIKDRAFYSVTYQSDGETPISGVSTVTYKSGGNEMPNSTGNCQIPTSVERLERYAFYNNEFVNVSLPSTLAFVGNTAFTVSPYKNSTITGITGTANSHFAYIDNGKGLVYRESNVNKALLYYAAASGIGNNPALNLSSHNTLTTISARALANTNYASVTLPTSITTIEGGAFAGNSSLKSVTGLGGLQYIAAYPYSDTSSYTGPHNGGTYYDLYDYYYEKYNRTIQGGNTYRSNKPNYFEWVGKFGAFANCTNLEKINFDECTSSLKKIGYGAFENCTNLCDLTSGNKDYAYYKYTSGVTQFNATTKISAGTLTTNNIYTGGVKTSTEDGNQVKRGVLDLSAHTNLTSIGRGAFLNCSHINYIHLPILQDNNISKANQANFYLGFDYDERGSWYGTRNQQSVFYGSGTTNVNSGAVLVGESALFASYATTSSGKYDNTAIDGIAIGNVIDQYDGNKYYVDRYHSSAYDPNTTYFYVRSDHVKDDLYFNTPTIPLKYWTYIGDPADNNYILFDTYQEVLAYYKYSVMLNGEGVENAAVTPESNTDLGRYLVTVTNDNSTITVETYSNNGQKTTLTLLSGTNSNLVAGEYVVVIDANEKYTVAKADLSIDGESELYVGTDEQFDVIITPSSVEDLVVWTSSDEEVAIVDSSGLVTPVGHGSATITASVGGESDSHNITVDCYEVSVDGGDPVLLTYDGTDGSGKKQFTAVIEADTNDALSFAKNGDNIASITIEGGSNLYNDSGTIKVSSGTTNALYLKEENGSYWLYFGYYAINIDGNYQGVALDSEKESNKERFEVYLENGDEVSIYAGTTALTMNGGGTTYTATTSADHVVYVNNSDVVTILPITATVNSSPISLTNTKNGGTDVAKYTIELTANDVIAFSKGSNALTFTNMGNATSYTAPMTGTYTFYINSTFNIYIEPVSVSFSADVSTPNGWSPAGTNYSLYIWNDYQMPLGTFDACLSNMTTTDNIASIDCQLVVGDWHAIIYFKQNDVTKQSNNIDFTVTNAGSFTVSLGISGWDGNTFNGATIDAD